MEKQKFTIGLDENGKSFFKEVKVENEPINLEMSEILIKYPIELKDVIDTTLEFTGDYSMDGSPIYRIYLPEGFKIVYKY